MGRILSLVFSLYIIIGNGDLLGQDYFPLKPGNQWQYKIFGYVANQTIPSRLYEYNGKKYFAVVDSTPDAVLDSSGLKYEGKTYQLYSMGRRRLPLDTLFFRKDTVGNTFWYDKQSSAESLFIPHKIKEGKRWMSSDKRYEFQIVSKSRTFQSESLIFEDCLVISVKRVLTTEDETAPPVHNHYFCKGIGEVGSSTGDKTIMMLLKWDVSSAR